MGSIRGELQIKSAAQSPAVYWTQLDTSHNVTLVFWDEQSTLIARGGGVKLVALNADGKEKTQLKWLAMIPLGSELNQTGLQSNWATW